MDALLELNARRVLITTNNIMFMLATSNNKFYFIIPHICLCCTIILPNDAWMRQMRRCVAQAQAFC